MTTNPAAHYPLAEISILPRRLLLDTPGVEATVPMLRGAWGAALHDLDPVAYRAVFDTGNGEAAPPAYLFRPAPPDPRFAPAIDWFLFGPALDHEQALVEAWRMAAARGLGPRRRPFKIRHAVALGPRGELRPLAEFARTQVAGACPLAGAWPLAGAAWPLAATAPCRLVFPAPLRLRRQGRLVERPTLADLVVAAARRIAAFLPHAQHDAWRTQSTAWLELARHTPQTPWVGDRLDLHRYSGRQQSELDLRGVTGWLELPEGPGELWQLLAAASWLHLGKGTVMGLGQLLVEKGQTGTT